MSCNWPTVFGAAGGVVDVTVVVGVVDGFFVGVVGVVGVGAGAGAGGGDAGRAATRLAFTTNGVSAAGVRICSMGS